MMRLAAVKNYTDYHVVYNDKSFIVRQDKNNKGGETEFQIWAVSSRRKRLLQAPATKQKLISFIESKLAS